MRQKTRDQRMLSRRIVIRCEEGFCWQLAVELRNIPGPENEERIGPAVDVRADSILLFPHLLQDASDSKRLDRDGKINGNAGGALALALSS